jgi:hypothetical protein
MRMKLTKSTIIQLIKEEIQSTLKEASWRARGRLRKKVNAACFKGGVVTKRGIRKLKSGGCPLDPNITYKDFGLARKAANRGDAAQVDKLLNKFATRRKTGGEPSTEYPYPGNPPPEQKPLAQGVDPKIVAKVKELDEMIEYLGRMTSKFEQDPEGSTIEQWKTVKPSPTAAGGQDVSIDKNLEKAKAARKERYYLLVLRAKIVDRANAAAGKEIQADLLPEIDRLLKSYEASKRART